LSAKHKLLEIWTKIIDDRSVTLRQLRDLFLLDNMIWSY